MKQLPLIIFAGIFSFGTLMFFLNDQGNDNPPFETRPMLGSWDSNDVTQSGAGGQWTGPVVRAPGKIEGKTETIELRTRIAEQILVVRVSKGMRVSKGDLLVSLDPERLIQERDLAKALLEMAEAKKQRLENGARASEIEAAKQDYEANLSPLWSAERALLRGEKLFQSNAISQQSLDNLTANVASIRAQAAAADARLKSLTLPARLDEMSAANADVHASLSRLKIAQINLNRSELRAPINGRILEVNARIGELTGPDNFEPMIVMVDTSQLHAVVEVDEYDALSVQLGQPCEITSDAREGILAVGRIIEIEPQMQPKKVFGQWAGERNDTFSRRVKIALEDSMDLPIGLPIEVEIRTSLPESNSVLLD